MWIVAVVVDRFVGGHGFMSGLENTFVVGGGVAILGGVILRVAVFVFGDVIERVGVFGCGGCIVRGGDLG